MTSEPRITAGVVLIREDTPVTPPRAPTEAEIAENARVWREAARDLPTEAPPDDDDEDAVVGERFNPNHDEIGRFSEAPGTSAAVAEHIAREGGITLNVHTGSQPHTGIAVGAFPEREQAVSMQDWDETGARAIEDYVAEHADQLLAGDVAQSIGRIGGVPHLGAWVYEGRVILDVTVVVPDRAAGIALGRSLGQVAVYDLATGEEIATGGEGGAALGAKSVPAGAVLVAMMPLADLQASPEARATFFAAVKASAQQG